MPILLAGNNFNRIKDINVEIDQITCNIWGLLKD